MTAGTLTGRVALVTGGGRGIGRGISLALAAGGATVAIGYRSDEGAARATTAEIMASGGRAECLQLDLEDLAGFEAFAAELRARVGVVDLLVANAGRASAGRSVGDTELRELERVMIINALATHQLCRLLLPGMRTRPRSDVIVISSSLVAHMPAGAAPYNMAKAAVEALAQTLAKEEADAGVRVNIVAPGLVSTDMGDRLVRARLGGGVAADLDARQPFGRVCRPDDVAAAVRFLASEEAALITGARLVIDGGNANPLAA
ncbi:3-oxoacyl-[acyl-carrier-protein] reductase FabG [Baekduia alba]|uniref:SDR family NAD(P)-dependent oxidoreductase n=1 Tax=Baekduia alba TaxID=2997333 RepID=UPI0023422F85|nr:SDR family oxidoreductase [Baekduia alba]WCB91794.1 3-oxoacyl-[acyl-carrier-protein] reductase FabG [Baekduia alba]